MKANPEPSSPPPPSQPTSPQQNNQVSETTVILQNKSGHKATSPTFVRLIKQDKSHATPTTTSQRSTPTDGRYRQPAHVVAKHSSSCGVAGLTVDCVIKYLRVVVLMSTTILLLLTIVAFGLLLSTSDLTTLATFETIYLVFQTVVGFYGAFYRNSLATLIFAGLCGLNFVILVIVLVSSTVSASDSTAAYDAIYRKLTWTLAWTQFIQSGVGASIWTFQHKPSSNTELDM